MSQSLYTAMGGISAAQSQINVISNNVANINTTAFKESQVVFQDLFSTTRTAGNAPTVTTGGKNPIQVGLGVQVGAIARNFDSGTWVSTGKTSDMMIQGNGFFTVRSSDGQMFLTKAGNFTFDSNGDLVTTQGYKVIGAASVYDTVSSPANVNIPQKIVTDVLPNTSPATSPSYITDKPLASLNNCQITKGTMTIKVTPATGPIVDVAITLDDTDLTMGDIVTKMQNALNAENAGVTVLCNETTGGEIKFTLDAAPTGDEATALEFVPGTSNFVIATQIGSAKLDPTTHAYSSKVLDYTVDVMPVTSLTDAVSVSSYTIGPDGSIEATYSNGDKLTIEVNPNDQTFQFKYTTSTGVIIRNDDLSVNPNVAVPANFQLQMANVVNPEGLVSMGGNLFMTGPNAGDLIFTVGGAMGVGSLKAGGLESSNVDLSKQLSDMILAQRAIQANSRVFTTTSDVMQTLVGLGR